MRDLDVRYPLSCAISSDGQQVAWVECSPDWKKNEYLSRVFIRSTSSESEARCLSEGWSSISNLTWARRDELLCWHGRKEGRTLIAIYDLEQSQLVKRCVDEGAIETMALDLPCVVFIHTAEKKARRLSKVATTEDRPIELVLALQEITHCASLAIRSAELVFTGIPGPDSLDQRRFLYHFDGKVLSILLGGDSAIFSPIWHRSRRRIAFLRRRGAWNDLDGASLCSLDLENGQEQVLWQELEYGSQLVDYTDSRILLQTQTRSNSLGLHEYTFAAECLKEAGMPDAEVTYGFRLAERSDRFSYIGLSERAAPEVAIGTFGSSEISRLSNYTRQLDREVSEKREWLRWDSADGAVVEGLLITGEHCDALLTILHGGPVSSYFNVAFLPYLHRWTPYPIPELLSAGMALFLPNYRGSAGRGGAFRRAIRGKLGHLECDDVLSGIDYVSAYLGNSNLPIGVAGWSYGGYLAALLGTRHKSRFCAVSAGAAITDWNLHRANSGNNMESYFEVGTNGCLSPIDFVEAGCPPILIQYGEQDTVINPQHSSAFHRKLEAAGGQTNLVVYRGGHVISTPQEMVAVRKDNLSWFSRHLISDSTGK